MGETIGVLVMAPHYSRLSVGAYFKRLAEAVQDLDESIEIARMESWKDAPGFLDALEARIAECLERIEMPGADPEMMASLAWIARHAAMERGWI